MRKITITVLVCMILLCIALFRVTDKQHTEYLRIHIRANSNYEIDQNIKYLIKDKVVDLLIPVLSECKTKQEAEIMLKSNITLIDNTIDNLLIVNGFPYKSKTKLANEFFPLRQYENLTLESGYYDAVIIELGEAKGDNWWCVVYPPLCFLKNDVNGNDVVYKSKILEIINLFR